MPSRSSSRSSGMASSLRTDLTMARARLRASSRSLVVGTAGSPIVLRSDQAEQIEGITRGAARPRSPSGAYFKNTAELSTIQLLLGLGERDVELGRDRRIAASIGMRLH